MLIQSELISKFLDIHEYLERKGFSLSEANPYPSIYLTYQSSYFNFRFGQDPNRFVWMAISSIFEDDNWYDMHTIYNLITNNRNFKKVLSHSKRFSFFKENFEQIAELFNEQKYLNYTKKELDSLREQSAKVRFNL